MKSVEVISSEELEEILAIGKARHYEETTGFEYLTEQYITTGNIDEYSQENLRNFYNLQHRELPR